MPRARSRRGSRHLFDRWAEVEARLASAQHVALFLDFDGTVVPLRDRPEEVWLGSRAHRVLARLARHPHLTLCLISGRALADLRKRVGVHGVSYIGLHGEQRGGTKTMRATSTALVQAKAAAFRRLNTLPGVRVEDKKLSFAVHYRGATPDVAKRARTRLGQVLRPFSGQLRVLNGKKVWEVLPPGIGDKGAAVRAVLEELKSSTLPAYVGDDTTDEAAFKVLGEGITVRVGPARQTLARYRLRDPQEVWNFLEKVEEEIP